MVFAVVWLEDPIIVDLHAGKNFRQWAFGKSPCITAARGKSQGFYIPSLRRRMTVDDMARLQGMQPGRVDWVGAGIGKGTYGHMIGNSMSVNVLERLLPKVLHAAGLLNRRPPDPWGLHYADASWVKNRLARVVCLSS